MTRWRLGEAYIQTQRYEEAEVELRQALSREDTKSGINFWLAYAAALKGDCNAALKLLAERKGDAEGRGHWFGVALVYIALGDNDAAFSWLDLALKGHDGQLALIKVEPMLKGIRNDPRYFKLLRRMNLLE